jgi:hypothetical protein
MLSPTLCLPVAVSPPVNVEMSDESDDEDYTHHPESFKNGHIGGR